MQHLELKGYLDQRTLTNARDDLYQIHEQCTIKTALAMA